VSHFLIQAVTNTSLEVLAPLPLPIR
jgi:hypothetical protein